jgi:hypothetical protein
MALNDKLINEYYFGINFKEGYSGLIYSTVLTCDCSRGM